MSPIVSDAQRAHLPIQVGSLNAERFGRFADAALMLLEDRCDVVALEARARLPQRAVLGKITAPPSRRT